MKLRLFNTLTQTKEIFTPIRGNKVLMYVCGITPYDTTHLGHAFTYTVFDVLYRFLEFQRYTVNYTQNVTDIDDDILKKAKEVGEDWQKLGQFWTDKFVKDNQILNNTPPTHYVKATEAIPTIIEIVKKLVAEGFAYEKNDSVYFSVQKDTEYGKLSKFKQEEMLKLSKERGADPDEPDKQNPLDFILWQKSKPLEPFWNSPWGKGRPGWHIECSAMIYKYLDKKIDIHGGGADLLYPHHESEIAQSEAFTGQKPFVRIWMHVGMLRYQGEKMSKSLGNLVMVSDLLKNYSPNAIRYLLLSHHYREPWEYHDEDIQTAAEIMLSIETKLKQFSNSQESQNDDLNQFTEALSDDLNTPEGLRIIHKTVKEEKIKAARKMLKTIGFIV